MKDNKEEKNEDEKNIIIEKKIVGKKEVTIDKYHKGALLGKGGFGLCYEFRSENDEIIYAGKILDKTKFKEKRNQKETEIQKHKENIQNEIEYQRNLKHPKIVKVISYFEDENYVYIVLEKCNNNTLSHLLKTRKKLTEIEVQCYIFQLIQGLLFLHNKDFIHRDLKPENLFLDDKLELKIGDFGLVHKMNKNEKAVDYCGTEKYMAPEIFEKKGYSFEVDIWAIGIIMYFLLTGKYPFNNGDEIKSKILNFPDDIKISKAAKNLIEQILVKEPKKRPNLSQILYHDFFHNNKFPQFLDKSTLKTPPDSSLFKSYNPDLNEDDLFNKDVKIIYLYKLKIPKIGEAKYENIDKYILKDQSLLKGFDYWVSYFHKSSHYDFYYYEMNNGLYGLIKLDDINIIINEKNQKLYKIINNKDDDEEKDEIEKYNIDNCPHDLQESVDDLITYHKLRLEKGNNSQTISITSGDKCSESNENNSEKKPKETEMKTEKDYLILNENIYNKEIIYLVYIKKLKVEEKANFLELSDGTKQIIFKDKVEIIMSEKKENLIYVDRHKERTKIPTFNILNNSNKDLTYILKYIKKYTILNLKEKMENKFHRLHPNGNNNENKG